MVAAPAGGARPAGLPPGLRLGVPDAAGLRFGGDALSETAFAATLADLEGIAGQAAPVDLAPMFAVAACSTTARGSPSATKRSAP